MNKPLSREEVIEEVAWQLDAGTSAALICTFLSMTPDAVAARLRNAGRDDLAKPFWGEVALRRAAGAR